MSGRPVLQSTFEYRIWKSLESHTFPKGGVAQLVNDVSSHEGRMNATVLSMLLEEMKRSGLANATSIRTVVSKSRSTDCLPSVAGSRIMLEKGDADGAEAILDMSESSQENVRRNIARAEIRMMRGDRPGAAAAARAAHGYDPSCREAYDLLKMLEPEAGWGQRENIQDVLEGGRPSNPPSEGRLQELYSIYYDWFSGRRDAATDRLIASRWYAEKDPEYRLASARMSADEKDWRSAVMVYTDLVKDAAPPFVLVEAAEACLGSGDPHMALDLLSRSGCRTVRAMKDAVRAHLMIGDRARIAEGIRSILDAETSGSDEYIKAVRFLLDRGMDREAASILKRYSEYIGDDSVTLTMRSAILMREGDYPSAHLAAYKAVRKDEKDLAAKAQLARMLYLKGDHDRATRTCEEILVSDPSNTDALELMAARHMASREYEKAAGICQRMLNSDPGNADAMVALAETRAWTGDRGKAEEMFRRAIRADGSRNRAVGVVSAMVGCGMDKEAESLASSLERLYSRDPVLKRLKGNSQYALGDFMKASVSFSEAISMDPENAALWHSKGMADEARGDWESAMEAYDRCVQLDDGEASFWISLAAMKDRCGDRKGAAIALDKAIGLDPGSHIPLVMKASLLSSAGRFKDAAYYLGHARAVRPSEPRILEMLAEALYKSGDGRGASEALSARLAIGPSENAAVMLARLRLSLGDRSGAVRALDDVLKEIPESKVVAAERRRLVEEGKEAEVRMPEAAIEEPAPVPEPESAEKERPDPSALGSMAEALLEAGDARGAGRAIDAAIDADPNDPCLYSIKARVILAKGDAEGALFLIESALGSFPRNAILHRTASAICMEKGDLKRALVEVDEAIANGSDDAATNVLKGRILSEAGQIERGIACYSKAVSMDPSDADSADELARMQKSVGDLPAAAATIARTLRRFPGRASTIMLKAETALLSGDAGSAREAASALRDSDPSDLERMRMKEILDEMGISCISKDAGEDWEPAVKRSAEKVLRRAYTMHTPADDPDILDSMGFDEDLASSVSAYIAEMPDMGRIGPGMDGFADLEKKSREIVMKLSWKDLEGCSLLPLEKIFISGGYRDADSAKIMRSYIAGSAEAEGVQCDGRLSEIASGLIKGTSVYDIMKGCGLGVYEAWAVKRMIVRNR